MGYVYILDFLLKRVSVSGIVVKWFPPLVQNSPGFCTVVRLMIKSNKVPMYSAAGHRQ